MVYLQRTVLKYCIVYIKIYEFQEIHIILMRLEIVVSVLSVYPALLDPKIGHVGMRCTVWINFYFYLRQRFSMTVINQWTFSPF